MRLPEIFWQNDYSNALKIQILMLNVVYVLIVDVFYHIKKVQNKLMFPDDLYIFISESIIDTTSSLQMLKNRTVRMCPSLNNRWRQLDLCLSRILH